MRLSYISSSPPTKKRRSRDRRFSLLPELLAQSRRYAVDVGFFPRAVGADRAAPAVVPAVVGALAVEGVGLVVEHVHAQLLVPVAVAARWRGEAGGGAGDRFGGFGRDARFARRRGGRRGRAGL